MTRRETLTGEPQIIQFFHPSRECNVGLLTGRNEGDVPWIDSRCGKRCAGHSRRLVSHKGSFVSANGMLATTQLVFWTEWEACTTAVKAPAGGNDPLAAHWIHTLKTPIVQRPGTLNTDPCVFGSTFKYCCCQQWKATMRNLAPGSLILFGSNAQGRFLLDTVFVTDGPGMPYETGRTESLTTVSPEYHELTLNRLASGDHFALYRGKSFQKTKGTQLYSFVPAKRLAEQDSTIGKRFSLNLEDANRAFPATADRKFRSDLGRFFWKIPASPETIKAVWKEILRQVYDAHFVPGVHFDWPNA